MTAEKIIYVLDTNILLHEPFAFLSFKEHDVVIPMTVLEELDYIKDSKKDVARDARVSIRAMEDLLHDATPEDMLAGVSMEGLGAGQTAPTGSLSIFADLNMVEAQQVFTSNENDNRIINVALHLQKTFAPQKVVLVTKDLNMRLKAKGAGLAHVEDYRTDQLITDIKYLSRGFHTFEGHFWDSVKSVDSRTEGRDTANCSASARSDNNFCPANKRPSKIMDSSCSIISSDNFLDCTWRIQSFRFKRSQIIILVHW